MKPVRGEIIKALASEALERIAAEGLTVREARRVASYLENEIAKMSMNARFQIVESDESASSTTDLISSEKTS